jgi:hypothetical protein
VIQHARCEPRHRGRALLLSDDRGVADHGAAYSCAELRGPAPGWDRNLLGAFCGRRRRLHEWDGGGARPPAPTQCRGQDGHHKLRLSAEKSEVVVFGYEGRVQGVGSLLHVRRPLFTCSFPSAPICLSRLGLARSRSTIIVSWSGRCRSSISHGHTCRHRRRVNLG